ncbi:Protein kinase of the Mitotic Exit Network [Coemansia sp. RSA 989]|nr:Protein kinase of the Mitotic Exit Network [Coemansia sp. RSA 989]
MELKPTSVQLGEFRPEELFGQLKAEQQSRNHDTAVKFIEAVLGEHLDACTLRESLRDGVVLCRLINALRPGSVKRINTKRLPFTQMENISNFLAAAQKLGLDSSDLFQTVDLYEGKNMPRVIMTLLAIARVVAGIPLNSHRKLSDTQRTLGDGWNSTTLTGCESAPPPPTPPTEYVSAHNQPTLVSTARSVGLLAPEAHMATPTSSQTQGSSRSVPTTRSTRHERRRSKRRSAATLFVGSIDPSRPLVPIAAADSDRSDVADCPHSASSNSSSSSEGIDVTESEEGNSIDEQPAMLATPPESAKDTLEKPASVLQTPQRKVKAPAKERLTVYSESAQRLTNYQLGNCIGRGQFGAVYRALDLETGEMVAVKQIPLAGQDAESMNDVMQEVELLKSLANPRVVRYYGFVKTDTHLNLVMEYVENGSLSATLKSFGAFPERLVLAYAVKIIEGLVYLHRRDVVHCDLKACNILTTKNGNTKLTDFGVSLNLKLRRPGDESVVAGTPYWMAPEIIQLEGACTASDIWSLGCTIIELLTGKPPYSGLLQMAALYRIVEDDHPPVPDGISEELKGFLLQCFQKDPADRPTAAELMDHPWTAQYRRNRKEMKMLRRTCSRKMSIARKRTACGYPPFNPAQLKPIAATSHADTGDPGSWEDSDLDASQSKQSNAQLAPSIHGENCRSQPEESTATDAAAGGSKEQAAMNNDDDTDGSISTFEGPRLKRHRLRTILCDANSICAVCSRTLSGAFIQCTSCKIRCHDACTQQLAPCTAMRMSRFLYPANRKSSKRYESKTPKIRLRATRKSTLRRPHSRHAPLPDLAASASDVFGSTCRSYASGLLGSSDGSLHMANLGQAAADSPAITDGFDGVIDAHVAAARPASIAVAMSSPVDYGQQPYPLSQCRTYPESAADSGWETDDAAGPFPHSGSANPKQQAALPAGINIPHARQRPGPHSAPLVTGSVPESSVALGIDRIAVHKPLYYKPLADEPPPRVGSITPLSQRSQPRSIQRMRANTASLDCLAGPLPNAGAGQERNSISTLFRRRNHPLRGGASSDFRAVAGFSPGAAQRAKRTLLGSNASVGDLQSCTTSELYSRSDIGLHNRASTQCFKFADKPTPSHAAESSTDALQQEQVSFFRSPFKVSYYSLLYLQKQFRATVGYVVQYPQTLAYSAALGCIYTALHFVDGPHVSTFHSVDAWIGWYVYWVALGVLSSVGLGAGLHTFVLFLGPHIARVTLMAHECTSMAFAVRGSHAFKCLDAVASTAEPAPFGAIVRKVIAESLCWGAGTAIGELPPYFIARAASAAGKGDAEYRRLQRKAAGTLSLKDRALLSVYRLLRRFGFAGILVFAAIPNPLFDLAGITCGHFKVPFWTFFGATFIGKSMIKATIQTSVVITAFSKETIAMVLSFLQHFSPWAHDLAERVLSQQAAAFGSPHLPQASVKSMSLLGSVWNACVTIMLIYFAISTLESFAHSYLAEVRSWGQQQLAKVTRPIKRDRSLSPSRS